MIVQVYKNLHNSKWSLREPQTGLVIGHADRVLLSDVTAKVSEAGRQRVLKEQRKNVHATISGTLEGIRGFKPFKNRGLPYSMMSEWFSVDTGRRLTYNPYKDKGFMQTDSYGNTERFTGCEWLDMHKTVDILGF